MFRVKSTKRPVDSGEDSKIDKKKKIKVDEKKESKIKTLYGCNKCDEVFDCKSKQRNHLSNSHGNKKKLVKMFGHHFTTNGEKTEYKCLLCVHPKKIITKNGMASHLGSVHRLIDKMLDYEMEESAQKVNAEEMDKNAEEMDKNDEEMDKNYSEPNDQENHNAAEYDYFSNSKIWPNDILEIECKEKKDDLAYFSNYPTNNNDEENNFQGSHQKSSNSDPFLNCSHPTIRLGCFNVKPSYFKVG